MVPSALALSFNRQLADIFYTEWCDLLHELSSFEFNYCDDDTLIWRWTAHGRFTVHSLYLWLEYEGVQNTEYNVLWSLNIPLKIKIFIWLVRRNKILTKVNLAKKVGLNLLHVCFIMENKMLIIYLFLAL
jgi:zinc-binding in reverse transcriptase